MVRFDSKDLLAGPLTGDYLPFASGSGFYGIGYRHRPIFTRIHIREMLTDPRIAFGLWLTKGPILTNARFLVKSDSAEVKKYVIRQVERFWRNSATRALKAIEWGYSAAETIYRLDDDTGLIEFDTLRDLDSGDVSIVTKQARLQGIMVRNNRLQKTTNDPRGRIYLGGPKAFLHVHMRERSPWYGLSRLFGAFIPWWEQWSDGGYRDIRRLWFYKNCYEGGTMYHPPGITRTKDGLIISNKDLAREMIEKRRTGGVMAFPNLVQDASGQRAWEYIPPQPNEIPGGLLDYGATLQNEILEGMGIPPEVVESSGSEGFGSSSGRAIPQMAFFCTLQEILQWLITDFEAQIAKPLVALQFDSEPFEIVPFNLIEIANEKLATNEVGNPVEIGQNRQSSNPEPV